MQKKIILYFKKHPMYNSIVHGIGGVGIGILLASPVAGVHPVRFGVAFLLVGVAGHLYAGITESK